MLVWVLEARATEGAEGGEQQIVSETEVWALRREPALDRWHLTFLKEG